MDKLSALATQWGGGNKVSGRIQVGLTAVVSSSCDNRKLNILVFVGLGPNMKPSCMSSDSFLVWNASVVGGRLSDANQTLLSILNAM